MPKYLMDLNELERVIQYYRTHLDVFIQDAFAPIKLTKTQHVIARAIGNNEDIKIVASRGFGKSWLTALCALALAVLYPGTLVAVVSGTAQQAAITLQKLKMLADSNPNIANELDAVNSRTLVQVSKDKGKATLKNGSVIESFSMDSLRGQRAKIVIEDEVALIDQNDLNNVVSPIKNYRREISFNYDFKDYSSKTISITSAVEKSNSFYTEFVRVVREMARGNPGYFGIALNWQAAVDDGITERSFFMKEKERMPEASFAMEYNSEFLGAAAGSAFPFDLTTPCRTLERIELEQPKNSKSRYTIGLDIATSDKDYADNAILTVLKFTELPDGSYSRKLVYIRSFHGKGLDILSQEVRKLYHRRFPNAERIIYDARGVGDAFDKFFDTEWVDPETGKEYPPLCEYGAPRFNVNAVAVLLPVRAINNLNQRIATNLRVALEKRRIEWPMNSRVMQANLADTEGKTRKLTMEETAIFLEADALQVQCGNVYAKVSGNGNVIYDCKTNQHKDRYSSLAYNNDYISQLEKISIKKRSSGTPCIGITSFF